jgi:hypothetical protein
LEKRQTIKATFLGIVLLLLTNKPYRERDTMKNFDGLRNLYADNFISLDELCRICKIAKRTGSYLIENGIIPAIDTGKETWRYKIAIDDVITYLKRREQIGSMIPPGAVTSRKNHKNRRLSNRLSFSRMVELGQEWEIAEYFDFLYAGCEDLLTRIDIVEMTGLDKSTVLKLLKKGHIKSIMQSPKYIVPRQYFMDFLVSERFIESQTRSEQFIKILGGFEIWKTAKLSQ